MPNPVLTRAIDALAGRRDLTAAETAEVLAEVMQGNASEVETAGVLIALRTKGETVEELFAVPLEHARQVQRLLTPDAAVLVLPDAHKTLAVLRK